MCFDTIASNTGCKNGSFVLLEQKLEKDLLRFACHHHIFKLILASVFNESMSGATSGPDVAIFKCFQQFWKCVDQSNYKTAIDNEVARSTQNNRNDAISFAMQQLENNQPRGDYHKFLELCIIFLVGTTACGVKFMAPGISTKQVELSL